MAKILVADDEQNIIKLLRLYLREEGYEIVAARHGREALERIKRDERFRRIPVVILTTSSSEEEVCRIYDLGANSFVTKPSTFHELVGAMRSIGEYWLELVALPKK